MTKAELVAKIASEVGLTNHRLKRRWTDLFRLFPALWQAATRLRW